jgi:tetratricopeptide (TPR) repeat protein
MQAIRTENAITRRLEKIQDMWNEFREMPTARCCIWTVAPDERAMIEAFYQVNTSENSKTPDFFIRLESPFQSHLNYGQILSQELQNIIDEERADLIEQGTPITWQSQHVDDPKNPAIGFLRNFFQLANSMDIGALLVAYLVPKTIANNNDWEKWWVAITELGIPTNIRLMVVDTEGAIADKLVKKHVGKVIAYKPPLDMGNAIRELMNETGDQNDKGTHFKKAFLELTQCIAKRDAMGMRQYAEKAIGLARQMGYPHLEIAVLCTTASGLITEGKQKTAVKTYDEALRVAQVAKSKPLIKEVPDLKVSDADGNLFEQLSIQILFSKGTAFVGIKPPQYESGLEAYQQADKLLQELIAAKGNPTEPVNFEQGGIFFLHRLEALRMSGYCWEGLGQKQKALELYAKAVTIAEQIPEDMRKSTTLNFVGQAMLLICQGLALKKEHQLVSDRMNQMLGVGWEKTLPQVK